MTDPREVLAQTEQRLAEVEALQLTLKETQLELNVYADTLRQKVEELRAPAKTNATKPAPVAQPAQPAANAKNIRPGSRPSMGEGREVAPDPAPRKTKPTLTDFSVPEEPVAPPPDEEPEDALEEADEDASWEDRRNEPRRKGNPVSVQVSNSTHSSEPFQGWVVDRSSGGLRLLVDQEVKAGTVLSVRPTKSHPGFTWVQVKVKSCKPERSSFNLGCQFLRKLSWTELQVFG
jgi:hypothetical protein